jgi:hypothetical protein
MHSYFVFGMGTDVLKHKYDLDLHDPLPFEKLNVP